MSHLFPLILASASPRRRQIITSLGLPVISCVAPGDEDASQQHYQGPTEGLAQWTATYKALMALTLPDLANRLIVTADTTVLLDDQILGKPRDKEHARALLLSLRGRWHRVVTSVVVCALINGRLHMHGASCTTPVLMRPYSEEEITAYIESGDPMDKAGSYGIQHPHFQPTECISGCHLNVVGLPLCTLTELLACFDIYPATTGCKDTACPWSEQCQK